MNCFKVVVCSQTAARNWILICLAVFCQLAGCRQPAAIKETAVPINLDKLDLNLGTVRFYETKQKQNIPKSVIFLFADGMADPGQPFRETDTYGGALPRRRLITAGISKNYCFVHYEVGGVGSYRVSLLVETTESMAKPIWASSTIRSYSLEQLKSRVESGELENQVKSLVW